VQVTGDPANQLTLEEEDGEPDVVIDQTVVDLNDPQPAGP